MPLPLSVSSHLPDRVVRSNNELREVLSAVDRRGGGEFWLASPHQKFPCLAVRTSAGQAAIHYFPTEGHPGFRRLAEHPNQSDLVFQFEGCDPYDGESNPGEFVIPLAEALTVADHFMQQGGMCEPSKWFEL